MRLTDRAGLLTAIVLSAGSGVSASADNIYVMGPGRGEIFNVVNTLTNAGDTVTNGGDGAGAALSDYSAYDQVWDLRFSTALDAGERSAFVSFLQGGGFLFLSGENATFDSRNNAMNSLLTDLGENGVSLRDNVPNGSTQALTPEGKAILGQPNDIDEVNLFFARVVEPSANGTLLSETAPGSGWGSLVAWESGDIASAPAGTLVMGYDIELLGGQALVQNIAQVPEPGSLALLALGGLFVARRRR